MMASRNYRDLIVWQKAMDLVVGVYEASRNFPQDELYGLRSQMRRAAVSIPSNIAEGQGRGSGPELVRYLRIAHGSLRELETQVIIARRLGYIAESNTTELIDAMGETGRLINGLIKSLD